MVSRNCELIFCLSTSTKCDFVEVEKAMFQVVECHLNVFFYFLTMSRRTPFRPLDHTKIRLYWCREAIFQWPAWHIQPIFGPWTRRKCYLREVTKAAFLSGCKEMRAHFLPLYQPKMRFRWSPKRDVSGCRMSLWSLLLLPDHVTLNSFSASWPTQNATLLRSRSDVSRARMELTTNYQPLDLPKSELDEFNKACFLVVIRHCVHIFWPLTYPNCDLVEVEKRWMKMWNGNLKSFYASWLTENANFIKSIKRRFNWSNGTIKSYSASWSAQISSSMMSRKQCFKLTPGTENSFSSS